MFKAIVQRVAAATRRRRARRALARSVAGQPNLESLLAAIRRSQHPLSPVLQEIASRLYGEVPTGRTYSRAEKVVDFLLLALEWHEEGHDFVVEHISGADYETTGEEVIYCENVRFQPASFAMPDYATNAGWYVAVDECGNEHIAEQASYGEAESNASIEQVIRDDHPSYEVRPFRGRRLRGPEEKVTIRCVRRDA